VSFSADAGMREELVRMSEEEVRAYAEGLAGEVL
jgi:hypothetical protein